MEGVSKGIANGGIKGRIKQVLILITVILIGILISQAAQAQSFHKAKAKHYKSKYRSQIKMNDRACLVLAKKKRSEEPKKALFAFLKRKPKLKPQAEVDGPAYSRSNRKQQIEKDPVIASN